MSESIKRCSLVGMMLLVGAAHGEPLALDVAPDTIEGVITAAECLGLDRRSDDCTRQALLNAQPGGILAGPHFTVLLIDGRILASTCAARLPGRLRAAGVLHHKGFAMSVGRLEEDCGDGWTAVDLPHAGTLMQGAGGGDE